MDGVHFKSWREVARLSEAAQRELLATGDPAERVWSIWAIGLRRGRHVLDDLQQDLDLEALPGIRCQLIVVLAGLGGSDLVRTVALHDPDPVVRATACQYVVRTLPVGSTVALAFAIERMRSDVPRVQHAMFEEVQAGRLRLPDEVLVEFLANTDTETRQLSLESVAALPTPSEDIVRALADRVLAEEDVHLRRACIDLYLRHGIAADLIHVLRDASPTLICEVLSRFERSGLRLLWNELATVASRADPDISLAVLDCLVERPEVDAIKWVSNLTAASLAIPRIPTAGRSPLDAFRWKGLAMLYKAVAPETVQLLDLPVAEALLEWLLEEDEDGYEEPASEEGLAKRELLAKHVASLDS